MMETNNACGADCGCRPASAPIDRREFIRAAGLTPLALAASSMPVMAGPFDAAGGTDPGDKWLDAGWVRSLTDRGAATMYRGSELEWIGMPVGGIGAGQLYIGGDGALWHWDLFNMPHGTGDAGYAHPRKPESPLEQGFAVQIRADGRSTSRALNASGFTHIEFCGQYPVAEVTYSDTDCPVTIVLEVFSPFIPLNADDSGLPATILNFQIKNRSKQPVEVTLLGWLQNAVAAFSGGAVGLRRNRIEASPGFTLLECTAHPDPAPAAPSMPDIVVEDWNRDNYGSWRSTGTAFGAGPIKRSQIPAYQGDVGGDTDRVVNSHATAPGAGVTEKDAATGTLTSKPFLLERGYLSFWIGGGAHRGRTCLNLLVDGNVVRSATGRNDNRMNMQSFDLREFKGRKAVIQIVDNESGPWGNIGVGRIMLSDTPHAAAKLEDLPDFGTMALALLGPPAERAAAASHRADFDAPQSAAATLPMETPLLGSLGRDARLAPGGSITETFVLAWHFPNLTIDGLGKVGRHYAVRFGSANAVVSYVAANIGRLAAHTRLWRDTWYDSSLPFWFLDRTLLNISTLATGACYRLANGRFYAWEGVGCCPGTCTHVWHYAHAMARLFPELERDTRERVDFGIAYHPETGVMGFRAEFDQSLAVDGQAGTLLRAYREHQMSADSGFLRRNWQRIKGAFEPLFKLDAGASGVLEGGQMNTLDQPWFGKIPWLSSLYVAALRAGEKMAEEMNEPDFSARCRAIADRGDRNIDSQLFNGEYYIQIGDRAHAKSVGSYNGCQIDQVFGASWAGQVGLEGVLPVNHVRSALMSLWKYNFLLDVGPYRAAHRPGRWYAMAGEAGLLMCSWPQGDALRASGGFDFYLNECMTGFEYQVAGHMIREGLITEGLAVTRAIHDRYHASKRNPWNEVECGDHYSRAMAGYGVYLSALGFSYHGPKGELGFAPRFGVGKNGFRAAFTAASGWGALERSGSGRTARSVIALKYGELALAQLSLPLPPEANLNGLRVTLEGRRLNISHTVVATPDDAGGSRKLLIRIPCTVIRAGQRLEVIGA